MSKAFPKKASIRRVHYIISSHWDREWYQTFQDYRRRLVKMLDRVLDDQAAGRLKGPFTLDGQAIPIEDYLEIRPERRAQIERAIQQGQLIVGPWYVLPDEWLVSGESLLRNLELGRKIARQWGSSPSDTGFVCDLFGHIGQLPQILRGFGITGALIWRGIEPRSAAHLIWKGVDGTELPCYRFGRAGYCDYTWDVRRCTEATHAFDRTTALHDLKAFLDKEAARTRIAPLLLFDGGDHLECDPDHYRLLFEQTPGPDFPYEIVHSTLDAYLKDMLQHRSSFKESVVGELREPGALPMNVEQQWLIPGVLSSRVWIKQANAECQTLLCQWAEPLASIATAFLGTEYPQGYLDTAWRWLVQNHPHDSICGCSIDEVHEDMKYRFAQCRQIATAQINESLCLLGAAVEGEIGEKELRVLVANPLARELDEPFELTLHIPKEWGCYNEFFGYEPKPAFRIYDAEGKEVPYQLLAQDMERTKIRVRPLKFPEVFKTNDITVSLRLKIPSLGYTTLTVTEGERSPKSGVIAEQMLPTRYRQLPALATSERSMENEFLAVTIESNGTLTVTDKRTREVYSRFLTFEDSADIGDGWHHGPAANDQCFTSTCARAEVALLHDGATLCRFRVRTTLSLPKEYDFSSRTRSDEFVPVVIDSEITLRAGCDRIEVTTLVDNSAKDHRLRVLFPSGVAAASYFSDGAFDVVERSIALPERNHLSRELAVETTPRQTWTALAKKARGLAVISEGLLESAVRDLPDRPLALTLFRCTRRTFFTEGQPAGQLQGEMTFRYWIVPLAKGIERRRLCDYGIQHGAGIRTVQLRAADLPIHRGIARIPRKGSFLNVNGDAVVTAVRHVDQSLQIRFFNPEPIRRSISLRFPGWPKKANRPSRATPIDFEGNPEGEAISVSLEAALPVDSKKIITLQIK